MIDMSGGSLDNGPLTTQRGKFLADALATAQQRFAEVTVIVDDYEKNIARAENAEGLLIGEHRQPGDLSHAQLFRVDAHFVEQFRGEHADGFLVQMRRQLARDKHAIRHRENATCDALKLTREPHHLLQREFFVMLDSQQAIEAAPRRTGQRAQSLAADAGNSMQIFQRLEPAVGVAEFDDSLGEVRTNTFDPGQFFRGARIEVREERIPSRSRGWLRWRRLWRLYLVHDLGRCWRHWLGNGCRHFRNRRRCLVNRCWRLNNT